MKRREVGFSLVEVLVAVALLGIIVVSVSLPVTGFFKVNRNSSLSLDATRAAQDAVEQARAVLLGSRTVAGVKVPNYPDPLSELEIVQGALPSTTNLTVTLSCADLNADGSVLGATCAASPAGPPLRRLTVVATSGGAVETRLSLEVRP